MVVLRDTPAPGVIIPDCLAAHTDDYTYCDQKKSEVLPPDPLIQAVAAVGDPRITLTDMTKYICRGDTCQAVVGGVPVYFDGSHMTATYARTLAQFLRPALEAAVGSS